MLLLPLIFHQAMFAPKAYLRIFHAGSLTVPFHELAKEFEKRNPGVKVLLEAYGSREAVRQIIDLKRTADIVAVSDYRVIKDLMIPDYTDWYIIFARNEIVIAYGKNSKYRNEISSENWYEIINRPDVTFGRSDPEMDPCGYRTLLTWKLAEKYYGDSSIYEKLMKKSSVVIRPMEAELTALLESGQIDYAFTYLSLAHQHRLDFVKLPDEINLGNTDFSEYYSTVNITLRDGTVIVGEPIAYAVTIPKNAVRKDLAIQFLKLLLSEEGERILEKDGQLTIIPGIANDRSKIPYDLFDYVRH